MKIKYDDCVMQFDRSINFYKIEDKRMIQHEAMPLKEGNTSSDIKQDQDHASQHTQGNCKTFNIIYLVIIAVLIWGVVDINSQQENIQKILAERQIKEAQEKQIISNLEDELQKQKQINNEKQKSIEQIMRSAQLKASEMHKSSMEEYHLKKMQYIRDRSKQTWGVVRDVEKSRISLLLAMSNFKFQHQNAQIKQEIDQLLRIQYQRLSKVYNFSLPELPFCAVVPTINNNQNFRNIYNLRSILRQNYTNFKVVILDDASTDKNFQVLDQYVKQNPIPQKVYVIKNSKKQGALFNIHQAATKYCSSEDILLIVDGDDELLGVNVFKTFNSVYTTKQQEVVYSNFIVLYHKNNQLRGGWSSAYTEEQKKNNVYRDGSTRMFPVRTFKVSTFLKIEEKNFKDDQGGWFQSASDQTYCPQVLELSCGKNSYIDQYFYLVNKELGSNDMDIDPNLNYGIMNIVKRRKKYQCPK